MLPDGWGIVLGGRLLGLPVPDRQGNDDICPKMFTLSAERGFSNFLFGCSEGTPEKAAANLEEAFPGIPIAGTLHGYWDVARGHPGRYDEADVDMMVHDHQRGQAPTSCTCPSRHRCSRTGCRRWPTGSTCR